VLLVGKGPPETGGIPAFLSALQASALRGAFDLEFLNLSRDAPRIGGRVNVANFARTATDAVAVARAARRADVVHIHSALAPGVTLARAGAMALAARAAGAAVIVHAHGGRIHLWLHTRARRRLARAVLGAAHQIVAVSQGVGDALAAAGLGVRVVENGVDVERFRPDAPHAPDASDERPVVAFVGILTPRKGLLDLFEASTLVASRGIDHRLVVAGGDPDEGGDAAAEVRRHAPDRAEFVGSLSTDDVVALLRSADVFCLPSWWEAMPLSVLEAMASGVPVVASSVGDVPRMVPHGECGLLVPARDPSALADALGALLSDADRRRVMGDAARRHVTEHYRIEGTVAAIGGIYEDVLARRRRGRRLVRGRGQAHHGG